ESYVFRGGVFGLDALATVFFTSLASCFSSIGAAFRKSVSEARCTKLFFVVRSKQTRFASLYGAHAGTNARAVGSARASRPRFSVRAGRHPRPRARGVSRRARFQTAPLGGDRGPSADRPRLSNDGRVGHVQ